ncbi:MAG TPA: DUF6084 family protein [Pyrinomonadaceae bacterium]|nr:DUF6084 family protein [Pyrinomonadaceae bacterium]
MPDLSFQVEGAEAVPFAASPLLALKLRVTNADAREPVRAVALRCQIQLEVTRRRYKAEEQERLRDLFGEPERWGQTLRTMLWTHVSVIVPPFTESAVVDLSVPCTFDFNIAATKYFGGLDDGEIPLCLLFSGTVFYEAEDGALQVAQIPWDREAKYRLPVQVWKQMMDIYYPNSAWLCLRRDVFDRLYQYKRRFGIPTWEQALERILPSFEATAEETTVEEKVSS